MKIAQVSPLYEAVPPKTYGGSERIVHYITEALVDLGHEVTLFASGDSVTRANLVSTVPGALRLNPCEDPLIQHYLMLEQVYRRVEEFDIVHFHVDYLHFPRSRAARIPNVTTLHGKLTIPDLQPLYREFSEMPVVSISKSQRTPLPFANWEGNVYHGLPLDLYHLNETRGDYLAFLGRISPEKGLDSAIEIARRSGYKLKVAAKIDTADKAYFAEVIQPLFELHRGQVEFVGEINDDQKQEFLGNARALLFPIAWPEPFGLVMIESMACGTPVVAFRRGSVPEIIEPGISGYVCDGIAEAVQSVDLVGTLDRRAVRSAFEKRFSARRMALEYVDVYADIIASLRMRHRSYRTGSSSTPYLWLP